MLRVCGNLQWHLLLFNIYLSGVFLSCQGICVLLCLLQGEDQWGEFNPGIKILPSVWFGSVQVQAEGMKQSSHILQNFYQALFRQK